MVLVGLILLIACGNVANLLLARGAARQKEFAMRVAMGAGRGRLVRQLLAESLPGRSRRGRGNIAGALGNVLLLRLVSGSATPAAVQLNLQPDARVLGFTLGVTLLTAILFGLTPSLYVTRLDLSPVRKSATLRMAGESLSRRLPLGKSLVVVQVAVSLILLVAAGVFVRSLSRLSQVSLGYQRENLLLFRVNAAAGGYKDAAATRLYQELLDKMRCHPRRARSHRLAKWRVHRFGIWRPHRR